jgi:hypothetical protein
MKTKTDSQVLRVELRIRQFYRLLSDGKFAQCYRMIDPVIRHSPASVTLYQYQNSLAAFLEYYGKVSIEEVLIVPHIDEPNKRFQDRDFAVGTATWADGQGEQHTFQERWVRVGRLWYTVSTGFVTPGETQAAASEAVAQPTKGQRPERLHREKKQPRTAD